jgi:hypothetical protein
MKLKHISLAAAIAVSSSAAFAAGPGDLGDIDNTPITVGNTVEGPLLFDVYTFNLVNPIGFLTGIVNSLDLAPVLGINGFSVVLQDSSANVIGTDTTPGDGFTFDNLSAGTYALTFVGLTTGTVGGSYGGVIFAQTIPEPETYALMLAGLGIVGYIAARRRRQG